MNSYDIFRKLTRGIKFDQKRFQGDLQKIGVFPKQHEVRLKPTEEVKEDDEDEGIDLLPEPLTEGDNFSSEEVPNLLTENKEDEGGGVKIFSDLHFNKTLSTSKKKKKKKKRKIGSEERVEQSEKQKLFQFKKEQVNRTRNQNGIHVWGSDIPEPMMSFEKLTEEYKVSEVIVNNLRKQGFADPMPIQMQAWSLMLKGREVLGSAPTGSGKTAAFLVPVLHQLQGPRKKGFRAVLLAPTRELARQTHRECVRLSEGLGFKVHIISNVTRAKQKFGPNSSKKFDILVTTPNRLVFLLQQGERAPVIDLSNVEWLVIDESDRLFEDGVGGFRDQLAVIYQACSNPNVKRALFSATFAYEVQHWCKLNLNNVAMVSIGIRNTASADVQQELLFCGAEHGKLVALRDILRKGYKPPVLVFVQTKERAKELFRELIYDNIMVDAIHADRTQLQRDNVVRAFRERKIWVLICTELMARGIDFKGVNLVINYDFPQSVISYIHRVGRTGRAQHKGRAVTFWTMEDKTNLQSIAQVIHNSRQEVPAWMLSLKKLTKNEKKRKVVPERGHVSQYDVYKECSRRNEKIKQNRQRKLEKKMATGANVEAVVTADEEMNPLISPEDTNPKEVKRKWHDTDQSKTKKKKRKTAHGEEPKKKKKRKGVQFKK